MRPLRSRRRRPWSAAPRRRVPRPESSPKEHELAACGERSLRGGRRRSKRPDVPSGSSPAIADPSTTAADRSFDSRDRRREAQRRRAGDGASRRLRWKRWTLVSAIRPRRGRDAVEQDVERAILHDALERVVARERDRARGKKDAQCDRERTGKPARDVSHEGRENDEGRGQDSAERQSVQELAVGQPAVLFHRVVPDEWNRGVSPAEVEDAGPRHEVNRRKGASRRGGSPAAPGRPRKGAVGGARRARRRRAQDRDPPAAAGTGAARKVCDAPAREPISNGTPRAPPRPRAPPARAATRRRESARADAMHRPHDDRDDADRAPAREPRPWRGEDDER